MSTVLITRCLIYIVELFLRTGTGDWGGSSSDGATSDTAGVSDAAPADSSSGVAFGSVDAFGAAVRSADLTNNAFDTASGNDDPATRSAGGQAIQA